MYFCSDTSCWFCSARWSSRLVFFGYVWGWFLVCTVGQCTVYCMLQCFTYSNTWSCSSFWKISASREVYLCRFGPDRNVSFCSAVASWTHNSEEVTHKESNTNMRLHKTLIARQNLWSLMHQFHHPPAWRTLLAMMRKPTGAVYAEVFHCHYTILFLCLLKTVW